MLFFFSLFSNCAFVVVVFAAVFVLKAVVSQCMLRLFKSQAPSIFSLSAKCLRFRLPSISVTCHRHSHLNMRCTRNNLLHDAPESLTKKNCYYNVFPMNSEFIP